MSWFTTPPYKRPTDGSLVKLVGCLGAEVLNLTGQM
jgi:hypothetical protein